MFLEVSLLVLAVQILSHPRSCFGDWKCLCQAECFWAPLTQRTLHRLQFLKTTLWSQHLTNKYIIPSNSEQPFLKGLRKKWFCFWDLPWKMTILSSLIFHATIVPHLTSTRGNWWQLKIGFMYFFLLFPRYFWLVLNSGHSPTSRRWVGKKHGRASTQSRWFFDGNVMGNGLRNVWCLSGTETKLRIVYC